MPNYAVSVPNTAQVAIYHDLYGRLILTSLTYEFMAGSPTMDDGFSLAKYVEDWWDTSILPLLSQQLARSVTIALSLDHGNFWVTGTTGPIVPGGKGSDAAPGNVGFRVDFDTALAGRAYRGWNTIPGIAIEDIRHNDISPTLAADFAAAYNAMLPGVAVTGWRWVIVSTMEAGAPRVTGVTTSVTNARFKDTVVDSSRHRLTNRRFS